jgi:hypothetical protein
MRYTLLLLLFSMALSTIAQRTSPEPKDDIIYLTNSLSSDSLFVVIGKRLAKAGFPLTTTNQEFGQIATGVRNMPDYNFGYSIVVSIENGKAEIKPTIVTNGVLGTYRWYYLKQKGAINYKVMEHIISLINDVGKIGYGKE